jgi:hypothetical protein
MRLPSTSRALRFPLMLAAIGAVAGSGAAVGCGPDVTVIWTCINPETGRLDPNTYDPNHYVDGVFDPCHCYDPCGEQKTCPILVDAGPPTPGCDGGGAGGGSG